MGDDRFDRLVRSINAAPTRRGISLAIVGAALASIAHLLGWLGPRGVAAACLFPGQRCERGDRCCGPATCRAGRCRCPVGQIACGRQCIDALTDPTNCGRCGASCAGNLCLHGACACTFITIQNVVCPTGTTGQCGCASIAESVTLTACVDPTGACDLSQPCGTSADCPTRSVCLRGCDQSDPNARHCSHPCAGV